MPQVAGFFLGAVGLGGTATGALAAGVAAGAAFSGTILGGILTRLVTTVAVSALMAALAEPPSQGGGLTINSTLRGEQNPETIILGYTATEGQEISPPYSHGPSNRFLNIIVELCSAPGATFERLMLNGEYVEIGTEAHADFGLPILGDYEGYAWIKYYDGTQVAADPMLVANYASHPDRPWTTDHIGTGICYAILTLRYHQEHMNQVTSMRCEMRGIPLYDIRLDSTAGGVGPHRWDDPSTWEQTDNPIVMEWALFRGIPLPGGESFGGGFDVSAMPFDNWTAQMNKCVEDIALDGGGTEPRYRAGLEVALNTAPAAAAEELLKACSAQVADMGCYWRILAGAPDLPVFSFTDDDILVSREQEYFPFPSLGETYNAVTAEYPDPEFNWEAKDAPIFTDADWEAEDVFGRRPASLYLPAVPYPMQVQRLQREMALDNRRFRRHMFAMGPDAGAVELLDTAAWTSARNGYADKDFQLGEMSEELLTGIVRWSVRERDSSDYAWSSDYEQPGAPPVTVTALPDLEVEGAGVDPGSIDDGADTPRCPAIVPKWSSDIAAGGIRWEVRLAGKTAVSLRGSTLDVETGAATISDGVLPATAYQIRLRAIAGRKTVWTPWMDVTTPDVRVALVDLATEVTDAIDSAADYAQQALDDAADVASDLATLTDDFVGDLNDLIDGIHADMQGSEPSILRIPTALWSESLTQASGLTKAPATAARFVTNDAQFGEAYVFPNNSNAIIGPAYPFDFVPGRVYKLTVKYRAVDDEGGSGVVVRIGASTFNNTTSLKSNSQTDGSDPTPEVEGIRTHEVYVSTDLAKLSAYGDYTTVDGKHKIYLTDSAAANIVYVHIRQYNSGIIAVGSMKWDDVTDVALISTALKSSIDGVSATLSADYYTAVQTDSAISAAQTTLQANIDGVAADLSSNYYTSAQADSAISTAITSYSATVDTDLALISGEIDDIVGLTVSGSTAFGTLMSQLNVNAGGTSLTIQDHAAAVVDMQGFASGFAGVNVSTTTVDGTEYIAGFQASVWADPDGSGGAVFGVMGDLIAPQSITTSKLIVSDLTNLLAGGNMEDAGAIPWEVTDSAGVMLTGYIHALTHKEGERSLRIEPSAPTVTNLRRSHIDVSPGEEFFFHLWARRDAAFDGTGGTNIRFWGLDGAGNLGTISLAASQMAAADTWYEFTHSLEIPSGVTRIIPQILRNHTAGSIWLDDASMRRKTGGELIVDGALTVQGMAAFGGVLQSSGFDGTIDGSGNITVEGTVGWAITDAGDAVFNNLTVRRDMVAPGSMTGYVLLSSSPAYSSDGSTPYASQRDAEGNGPFTNSNSEVIDTLTYSVPADDGDAPEMLLVDLSSYTTPSYSWSGAGGTWYQSWYLVVNAIVDSATIQTVEIPIKVSRYGANTNLTLDGEKVHIKGTERARSAITLIKGTDFDAGDDVDFEFRFRRYRESTQETISISVHDIYANIVESFR